MIYYEPQAGLCNRMRGIASCYRFAQEIGQTMTILWINNQDCNCRIDQLFELPSEIQIIDVPYLQGKRIRSYYDGRKIHSVQKRCENYIEGDDIYQDISILKQKAGRGNCYISSAANWYQGEKVFEIFRLSKQCSEKVEKIKQNFRVPMVGIHIRRTDHVECIQDSPTELFLRCMQRELERAPQTCFYVASDSQEEKKRLMEQFPDKVIIYPDIPLKRNSPDGIIAAAAELYLLASTGKIYGSKGSSYSDTAAQIYGIPYESVCREREQR